MPSSTTDRLAGARSSLGYKAPCRVATTANVTLSGLQTINGVALAANDRVLVKDQTDGTQNGIYVAKTTGWIRPKDFSSNEDITQGTRVNVTGGSDGRGRYQISTVNPIVIGTTSITFELTGLGATADIQESLLDARRFDTKALAEAFSPSVAPKAISISGYTTLNDGGGALYLRVASEPSHAGKFSITLADTSTEWYEITGEVITPQAVGVVAGSGASQTTAVGNAIDVAVAINAKLYWPPGTYRMDTGLTKTSGLVMEFHPDAIVDFTNSASSTTLFDFDGSYGTAYSITAGAALGGTTFTVSIGDSANFAYGQLVLVTSDDVYDASDTNSEIGEYVRVKSVDTGTGIVTIDGEFQSAYTTSPTAEIPTFVENLKITGGTFRGGTGTTSTQNGKTAFALDLVYHCHISECRFERFDERCIALSDSVDAHVRHCVFKNAQPNTTGYGVSFIDATNNSSCSFCHFEDVRHSLSTNNTRKGVTRRITFSHNHVHISAEALGGSMNGGDGIDTHAAAEDIDILYNTVLGSTLSGINAECRSVRIIGNTIVDAADSGIVCRNETDLDGSVVVSENVIRRAGNRGISIFNGTRGTTAKFESVIIANNNIEDSADIGIFVFSGNSADLINVAVNGNVVHQSTSERCMRLEEMDCVTVTGNICSQGAGDATNCVELDQIQRFTVTGNTLQVASGATGDNLNVRSTAAGDTTHGVIGHNILSTKSGTSTGDAVNFNNNVQYTLVQGNIVRDTAGITLGSGTGNVSSDNIT